MAESKKYSGYIFKGSVAALLISIWTEYIKWTFSHITKRIEAFLFFIFFCFLIGLFILISNIFKDFLDRDSDKLKDLAELLEKILYDREFSNKDNDLKGNPKKSSNTKS